MSLTLFNSLTCSAIFLLLLIYKTSFINADESFDTVCLLEEWPNPVESIGNIEQLFELIPRQESQQKTENNIFLHLYRNSCTEQMSHPMFVGSQYQTGPVLHLATLNYEQLYPEIINDWKLSSNCSHFVWIPYGTNYENIDQIKILTDSSNVGFSNFIKDSRHVHVNFMSEYPSDINFYWYEKDTRFLEKMEPQKTRNEFTFLGHIFMARDATDGSFIDLYPVLNTEPHVISKDAQNAWCIANQYSEDVCSVKYEEEMTEWVFSFWARKREALNFVQPKMVPNFTAIGFSRSRLPENIFRKIREFWNGKQAANDFTDEHSAGPVLNQNVSPTLMAHLGPAERRILIEYFQRELSKWANLDASQLTMTSLYGIRKYTRGAVLALHVDTCRTHVLSAILTVDTKLDEGKDWPLQIYDHFGQMHEISMRAGDVVFYESAKCNHSRRKALPGEYYANLFIHYQPSGHWNFDWF